MKGKSQGRQMIETAPGCDNHHVTMGQSITGGLCFADVERACAMEQGAET